MPAIAGRAFSPRCKVSGTFEAESSLTCHKRSFICGRKQSTKKATDFVDPYDVQLDTVIVVSILVFVGGN